MRPAPAARGPRGDGDSFTTHYRDADGRLLAALTANRPGDIGALRRELAGEAMAVAA